MSRNNNVTMIDDLPYLEELERQSSINGVPSSELKQISKFIRNTGYNPPFESGMNQNQQQRYTPQPEPEQFQQQAQPPQQPPPPMNSSSEQIIEQNVDLPPPQLHKMHRVMSLSCVDVAEHASNCIVCSKLYNTDTSLYIIAIAILLLVVVILFKKILDSQYKFSN
jgi:hypothetical protein